MNFDKLKNGDYFIAKNKNEVNFIIHIIHRNNGYNISTISNLNIVLFKGYDLTLNTFINGDCLVELEYEEFKSRLINTVRPDLSRNIKLNYLGI